MSEATGLKLIQEAQDNLKTAGLYLNTKQVEQHKSAAALMFLVREAVLEIFEESPKTRHTRPIYRSCLNDDSQNLSSATYNLLTHRDKSALLDLMKRYQSIVSGMYAYLDGGGSLQVRDLEELTKNWFIEDVEMDRGEFRSEIVNLQVDIDALKKRLQWKEIIDTSESGEIDAHVLHAREILASDIICMREKLHRFFGVIHGEIDQEDDEEKCGIVWEFHTEMIEDYDSLGMIVAWIIDEWAIVEAIWMVERLADFAKKMFTYLENGDVHIFSESCIAIQGCDPDKDAEDEG